MFINYMPFYSYFMYDVPSFFASTNNLLVKMTVDSCVL